MASTHSCIRNEKIGNSRVITLQLYSTADLPLCKNTLSFIFPLLKLGFTSKPKTHNILDNRHGSKMLISPQ